MTRALPRRLPRLVGPARHEILGSYLGRLARLNHLDGDELWKQVSVPGPAPSRRIVTAERVSALTGRPPGHLAGALPELRPTTEHWLMFRHVPQRSCPRCDARHQGGPVWRVLPHHRYVCIRHQHWIGPPDGDWHGQPLGHYPEALAAQRRHLRLLRHFGWAASYDAILTAFMICAHRWDHYDPTPGLKRQQQIWETRSLRFIPVGRERTSFSTSKLFACLYPEAVALAPVIAAPRWRALASGNDDDLARFLTEARSRLDDSAYRPRSESDALAHWIESDSWRQPTTPPKTFPTARGNRTPSQVGRADLRTDNRNLRSGAWFGLKQRREPGNAVLHHLALHPVIVREWSPDMQEFRGAIWRSRTTEKRFRTTRNAN